MSDAALRRTIRRSTALLLLPLLVLVVQFDSYLAYRGLVDAAVVELSRPLAAAALVGVAVYLAASLLRGLSRREW